MPTTATVAPEHRDPACSSAGLRTTDPLPGSASALPDRPAPDGPCTSSTPSAGPPGRLGGFQRTQLTLLAATSAPAVSHEGGLFAQEHQAASRDCQQRGSGRLIRWTDVYNLQNHEVARFHNLGYTVATARRDEPAVTNSRSPYVKVTKGELRPRLRLPASPGTPSAAKCGGEPGAPNHGAVDQAVPSLGHPRGTIPVPARPSEAKASTECPERSQPGPTGGSRPSPVGHTPPSEYLTSTPTGIEGFEAHSSPDSRVLPTSVVSRGTKAG